MADPFSVAQGAGMGLSAIGTITKMFGGNAEAESVSKMHAYKAGLARQNAAILRQNSDWTVEAGERNASLSGLTTGFRIGGIKTAQAASGFDVNEGTPAEVREAQRKTGYEDQSTIRREAGRKALGFRNQAAGLDAEAAMEDQASANARKSGKLGMISTLLGGAGSVADRWAKWSKVGGSASSGITTYDENFLPIAYTPT